MRPTSLRFKVGVYPAIALLAALAVLAVLMVWHQRRELREETVRHVNQLSEMLIRSTRFAMLQNRPEYVHQIIQDVARQQNIAKVRIFSKEGVIIDSTDAREMGSKVDARAEGCLTCHQSAQPAREMPQNQRARVFVTAEGERMLASMQVIPNEPSCSSASCHVHSPSQTVLGVLDIVYSLEESDRALQRSVLTIVVLLVGFAAVAAALLSGFVHRLIYVPLRDLKAGAQRIAAGDLEQRIPARSGDEFGQLAASFNAMTDAVRKSQSEQEQWSRTLEQKVEQRTRELRRAEAEAARGEKLASVGLLAAGVAHELNSPLTGILTFSTLMRRKMPEASPEAEDLDLVIQETKRCASIIRRLLDFAREKAPEKNFTDLNRLIENTARIVERPAHLRNIEIRLELDPRLPPVWADANMIEQVVMNMLVNAQQAIDERGSITVRTRRAAAGMAEISIIDTGCGIAEANLQRIFDPFYSSKEVGKGTGLGLSVSHSIVEAHGGWIEVESKLGEGSTFRVTLPLEPTGKVREAPTKGGAIHETAHPGR